MHGAEVFPRLFPSAEAFTEWKRKTSQIQRARGISGTVQGIWALRWAFRVKDGEKSLGSQAIVDLKGNIFKHARR